MLPVLSGVPQGSILGPLLFILYINDIPSTLKHVTTYLFADDTKCLHTSDSSSNQALMQEDLDTISTWSKTWKLSFNCNKSAILHFWNTHSQPTTFTLNDNPISSKTEIKDLGVIIKMIFYGLTTIT